MARLVFIEGRRMGNAVALRGADTLGRAPGNSIVLDEAGVLDRHASIDALGGRYRLSRAEAAAAVSVNGKPLAEPQALRHGDTVTIGGVTLLFTEESPGTPDDILPARAADPADPRLLSTVRHFPDPAAAVAAIRRGPRPEERLEILYRLGSALHAAARLDELSRQFLNHLQAVFRPERGLLFLCDGQGRLRLQARRAPEKSRFAGIEEVPAAVLQLSLDRKEAILMKGALCAPLVRGDRVLGLVHLDASGPGDAWGEDDLQFLNAAASQASLAVDNVLAHQREVETAQSLRRLGEGSRRVSSFLGEEAVVREAVDQACRLFECSKASVLLLDPAGQFLTVAGSNGIDPGIWSSVKIRPGEGYAGRAFAEGRPILGAGAPGERRYETSSFLVVPILSRGEGLQSEPRPIGVLSATDKASGAPFTPNDQELLSVFAAQVGIALTNASLFERATVDPLTRLYTRQYLDFRLADEIRDARARGTPLSILMGDLDHFKDKNDIYGHPVGDVILREAGSILRQRVPPPGFAARYGGEEFVAVLPGIPEDRAADLAQDIRLAVEEHPFNAGDEPIRCTVSIGVAALEAKDDPGALIKRSDTALHAAKRRGRNRVEKSGGRA
jgi:diguanylate cyclase (GGDEF)-like protein